jgi:hypothetical protein
MANEIEIYKNNSKVVNCTISGTASLAGYAATMTVKKNAFDPAGSSVISKEGTLNGLIFSFDLTPAETNIAASDYDYDITVTEGANIYTVTQGKLTIIENVRH